MNKQIAEGNWAQMKGKLREHWGKLTDNDVEIIAGRRDQLVGKVTELYGRSKEQVETELAEFEVAHFRDH